MNIDDIINEALQKYPEPDEFTHYISNLLNNISYEEIADSTYENFYSLKDHVKGANN